jgi:hypothetical protein
MTCRAAVRHDPDGGVHRLSFLAITPEEAAEGYCAKCEACGSRFKNAVEWLITECKGAAHATPA